MLRRRCGRALGGTKCRRWPLCGHGRPYRANQEQARSPTESLTSRVWYTTNHSYRESRKSLVSDAVTQQARALELYLTVFHAMTVTLSIFDATDLNVTR